MQTQQNKKTMFSAVFPNALKTRKKEREITCRGEANDINNNFSSSSDCNLFSVGLIFPYLYGTLSFHYPFCVLGPRHPIVVRLKKMEVGDLSKKHYFYFSTGNLKVTREWSCF